MGTLRFVWAVGLTITLGAGCAVNGEHLSGTGGHSAATADPLGGAVGGGGAGGVGGAAIGGGGQGGVQTCSCTQTNDPVCGVDGVSYSNACEAGCYGVAVAHQGACSADGGGGGVPNSCNSDSDCVVVPFGCCGWTCQARGAFAPDPIVVCNMACPVGPPVTCGCADQTCIFWGGGAAGASGGGAAGSSGSAGSSGAAGSSGVAGAGGGSSCDDLDRAYVAALAIAQRCDVGSQGTCQQEASPSLSPCTYSCPTIAVNDATALNLIKAAWLQQQCEVAPAFCPAIACVQPAGGACVAGDSGGGRCQTRYSGTTY